MSFELLRYLSQRISNESEDDESYALFLTPIFLYFETLPQSWSQVSFAKLVFYVIINNGVKCDISAADGLCNMRDWISYYKTFVRNSEVSNPARDRRSAAVSMQSSFKSK